MARGHLLSHVVYICMTEAPDHPGLSVHTVISKGNFDQMPGLHVHQALIIGLGAHNFDVRQVLVNLLAHAHCAKVAEHLFGTHGSCARTHGEIIFSRNQAGLFSATTECKLKNILCDFWE